MKVTWTRQTKTDDPKEALEMAMGKWWFFANCTKAQLKLYGRWLDRHCGLCKCTAYSTCRGCVFSHTTEWGLCGCPPVYTTAKSALWDYRHGIATLKDFHASARKVWDKLKSLS